MEVAVHTNSEVKNTYLEMFEHATQRLIAFEPIQYILGHTEFHGLNFHLTTDTLIPRPETEELVSILLKDLKDEVISENITILDIGTGSGCIAIALAHHFSQSTVSGLDISEKALAVARANAIANRVEVNFFQQDILRATHLPEMYDVIVSNPPYVRELERAMMRPNVLNYEPGEALFVSDADPLIFYRSIAALGRRHLRSNGCLFFEINEYLGNEMVDFLQNLGYIEIELFKDFRGKDRFVKAVPDE
jgi:release factor glutamine methyltransferase